jgi:ankyrin repeat protein
VRKSIRRENMEVKMGRFATLHLAAIVGNVEVASLLISAGAVVDKRDGYGRTAMHFAALCGDTDMMALLVDNGAEINVSDNDGYSVLDYTVIGGRCSYQVGFPLIVHGEGTMEPSGAEGE